MNNDFPVRLESGVFLSAAKLSSLVHSDHLDADCFGFSKFVYVKKTFTHLQKTKCA